jgi:CubicO group peptidase (beta-lactamase class C family)
MLPFRYSMGFMLGAEWFSLYGPHTRHAFGHIGFTNVIGWADPDRDVSGALLTSGKPLLYPEIYYVLEMLRQIVAACPEDGVGIGAGSTATTGRRFDSRADVG